VLILPAKFPQLRQPASVQWCHLGITFSSMGKVSKVTLLVTLIFGMLISVSLRALIILESILLFSVLKKELGSLKWENLRCNSNYEHWVWSVVYQEYMYIYSLICTLEKVASKFNFPWMWRSGCRYLMLYILIQSSQFSQESAIFIVCPLHEDVSFLRITSTFLSDCTSLRLRALTL
jgi:hypothetical protein